MKERLEMNNWGWRPILIFHFNYLWHKSYALDYLIFLMQTNRRESVISSHNLFWSSSLNNVVLVKILIFQRYHFICFVSLSLFETTLDLLGTSYIKDLKCTQTIEKENQVNEVSISHAHLPCWRVCITLGILAVQLKPIQVQTYQWHRGHKYDIHGPPNSTSKSGVE